MGMFNMAFFLFLRLMSAEDLSVISPFQYEQFEIVVGRRIVCSRYSRDEGSVEGHLCPSESIVVHELTNRDDVSIGGLQDLKPFFVNCDQFS
jgi:hypothetical protein